MIEDILSEARQKMEGAIGALGEDLAAIRTGRASPALLDRLRVPYYGVMTPLRQMAAVSAPEPRLLVIRPWEASALRDIERAILQSDLGLTPMNDGKLIRLNIPPLSEERRRELVRQVSRRLEEARVAIRSIRRDAIADLREMEEEKLLTEDEQHRGQGRVQELTDEYVEKVKELGQAKEEEIMEV